VRVPNGHQFRIRVIQKRFHPAPHVIVVKADYGKANLRRLGKSHAYSQTEKKNQDKQLFHGSTFLKNRSNVYSKPGFYYKSRGRRFSFDEVPNVSKITHSTE
jgi:hypothetical protein